MLYYPSTGSILLRVVRPKIDVSDEMSEEYTDEGVRLIRIKVVNKTRCMLTNVKYALNYCKRINTGVISTERIKPFKEPLIFIDKYSEEDDDDLYAYRLMFEIPKELNLSDKDESLEFSIYAEHELASTCTPFARHSGQCLRGRECP